jgi:hypothetical protein
MPKSVTLAFPLESKRIFAAFISLWINCGERPGRDPTDI